MKIMYLISVLCCTLIILPLSAMRHKNDAFVAPAAAKADQTDTASETATNSDSDTSNDTSSDTSSEDSSDTDDNFNDFEDDSQEYDSIPRKAGGSGRNKTSKKHAARENASTPMAAESSKKCAEDSDSDISADSSASDSSDGEEDEDVNKHFTLDVLNLKGFLCELGVLCSDDVYSHAKLLALLKYINVNKFPKLFSINPKELATYFHQDAVKRCIDLLKDNHFEKLSPEDKADALKDCLVVPAWQELLDTDKADLFVSCLIDLCCGCEISKKRLQRCSKFLEKVQKQQGEQYQETPAFIQCFNIPEIQAIIQDRLADKNVPRERVIKVIVCDTLFQLTECKEETERLARMERLLRLLFGLLHAGNEQSLGSLLNCIKWDNVIEVVPELFGFSKRHMSDIFDIPKLKLLIRKIQKKKLITKEELLDTLSADMLSALTLRKKKSLMAEILREFVDFDRVARFINSFIDGNKKERKQIKKAFYWDKIERVLGINIPLAFNILVPEGIQTAALTQIVERLSDTRITYSLPVVGYPLPILLALKALSAQAASSRVGYLTATAATLYLLYKFAKWTYATPLTGRTAVINAALSTVCSNAMRMVGSWRTNFASADTITRARHAYEGHDFLEIFEAFAGRLTKPQLNCLKAKYALCQLLEPSPAPFSFVDENWPFIESLYKIDQKDAETKIQLMAVMFEKTLPPEQLKFYSTFIRFTEALTDKDKKALAEESLLMLAQYRPGILYTQPRFIESIAKRRTTDGKQKLLGMLRMMAEGTKNPNNLTRQL